MGTMTMPSWMKDQMGAAAKDNAQALREVGLTIRAAPEIEERLDRSARQSMEVWGVFHRMCPHLYSIQPSFLPMANPWLLLCVDCLYAYAQAQIDTPEDNTCDLCRRLAGGDGVRPFAVGRGHVTVLGGACRACWGDPSFDEGD